MRGALTLLLAGAGVLALQAHARAWDPFLVQNDEVEDGNERMAAGDARSALEHYERAARALPNEGGVHLNRGLALMEAGELDRAREAFLLATEPPASTDVRADAYYDLGLAFYRQADAAAGEENHQEAQRLFREAADAFRRSLRIRPGNDDAGWNLELALRRIREQEEQQQQQEEQNQDQQNQDQQNQDQQNQDQQNQDQQSQDQQSQDQQSQDQPSQDQQNQDQQNQDQQSQDQQSQDQQSQGDESSDGSDPSQDPGSQDGQDGAEGQGETPDEQQPPSTGTQDDLAPEHRRVLDALEQGEENLERARARARAAQERRRVEQDW